MHGQCRRCAPGILIGTQCRTEVLGKPVGSRRTRQPRRRSGNATPYGWIHGHEATVFTSNRANGTLAALAAGMQPPINPFPVREERVRGALSAGPSAATSEPNPIRTRSWPLQ
jgi:hypothetical protein